MQSTAESLQQLVLTVCNVLATDASHTAEALPSRRGSLGIACCFKERLAQRAQQFGLEFGSGNDDACDALLSQLKRLDIPEDFSRHDRQAAQWNKAYAMAIFLRVHRMMQEYQETGGAGVGSAGSFSPTKSPSGSSRRLSSTRRGGGLLLPKVVEFVQALSKCVQIAATLKKQRAGASVLSPILVQDEAAQFLAITDNVMGIVEKAASGAGGSGVRDPARTVVTALLTLIQDLKQGRIGAVRDVWSHLAPISKIGHEIGCRNTSGIVELSVGEGLLSTGATEATLAQVPGGVVIRDIRIVKPLTRGAYGRMYLGVYDRTGDVVAVKVLPKAEMVLKNCVESVISEKDIMRFADNPFVVRLQESFQTRVHLFLVMEYMPGGDLFSLLDQLGQLPEEGARFYVAETAQALLYLHSIGIVHRDVKPDNILIGADGHIKLTDFGLASVGMADRRQCVMGADDVLEADTHGAPMSHHTSGGSLIAALDVERRRSSLTPSLDVERRRSSLTPSGSTEVPVVLEERGNERSDSVGGASAEAAMVNDESSSPNFDDDAALDAQAAAHPRNVRRARSIPDTRVLDDGGSLGGVMGSGRRRPRRSLRPRHGSAGATRRSRQSRSGTAVGTPDYMSPEVLLGNIGNDEEAIDWWALGVVLFELLCGVPPFEGETVAETFANIIESTLVRPTALEMGGVGLSDPAWNAIIKLLDRNASRRARNAQSIASFEFFRSINFDKLRPTDGTDNAPTAAVEPFFVPKMKDPLDTGYFDARHDVFDIENDLSAVFGTAKLDTVNVGVSSRLFPDFECVTDGSPMSPSSGANKSAASAANFFARSPAGSLSGKSNEASDAVAEAKLSTLETGTTMDSGATVGGATVGQDAN